MLRRLEGSGKTIHGEATPATGAYREQLEREQRRLLDQLEYDRGLMALRRTYGRESVAVTWCTSGGWWSPSN